MQGNSFGFIGGGRVSRLLLQALKQKNALPKEIWVADPNDAVLKQISQIDPSRIKTVTHNQDIPEVDILFLAVHPPVMKEIVTEISGNITAKTLVMSLIPVITIEKLSSMLGGIKKIVRMIPNAPSIIHQGYNPVAFGPAITSEERQQLQQIFQRWGEAPEVDETKLEAYAIVTAMGPTYFWPQWAKLHELGKEFGISEAELNRGMAAMLNGSVALMYQSDLTAEQVMDLIPVFPLKEKEETIRGFFDSALKGLYQKLKGISK